MRIAHEQWEVMRTQIVSQEQWSGVMRGAWQIVLLGGFVFVVLRLMAQAFLGVSVLGQHTGSKDLNVASLATTLGVCLFGSFLKAYTTRKRIDKLGRAYNEQISRAEKEYVASARIEYEICALQSVEAWRTFTS